MQKVHLSVTFAGFEESCGAILGGELDAWVHNHTTSAHTASIVILLMFTKLCHDTVVHSLSQLSLSNSQNFFKGAWLFLATKEKIKKKKFK